MEKLFKLNRKSMMKVKGNNFLPYLIFIFILSLLTPLGSSAQTDPEPVLEITSQPVPITIVQKSGTATLSCTAAKGEAEISYQWYLSTDGTTNTGTKITGAESSEYTTEPFDEKEIKYYYCEANSNNESILSDIVAVAYTGLATIIIETENHEEPTAEYYNNYTIINETKVPSRMWLYKDGVQTPIYDSKEYVKKESGLTIKLRGNTSAYTPKKPYKIKLQKKDDLLADLIGRSDKKYKDKDWILLKDGTSLNTFVGLSVASIAGSTWTPEFAYVNVIMNGEYRGIYMLIESINQSKGRVDVSDNGYIIEVDTYYALEPFYFRTNSNRTITFKYPNDDAIEENKELLTFIKKYMDLIEDKIKKGDYEDYIDTESFARWQLIHDLLGNKDYRGSNIYMTKYDNTTPDAPYDDDTWSKVSMSTPWDFDGIYYTKDNWAKQHFSDRNFATSLFINQNSSFLDSYQKQWNILTNNIWSDLSTKLSNLKNDIGEEINLSRELDALKWNTNYVSIEQDISSAENWFNNRIEWLNTEVNNIKRIIVPDFSNIMITSKTYNGDDNVDYTGEITIKNTSSIIDNDDVSLHITSIKYDSKNIDAKSAIISYEIVGRDKDKYALLNNELFSLLDDANTYYNEEVSTYMLPSNIESIPATITPKPLTNPTLTLSANDFTYTGLAIEPSVTVSDGKTTLTLGTDYSVTYDNNINAGTGKVIVTFKGNYSGKVVKEFNINAKNVIVTAIDKTKIYGDPDPEFTADVEGLIGSDKITYTISRVEGSTVGEYEITPTGTAEQGNYAVTYVVGKLSISKAVPDYPILVISALNCGETLDDIILPSGFSFTDPETELSVGENKITLSFTPSDTYNYEIVTDIKTTINLKDHKPSVAPVKENEIAATCDQEGSYDEVVYCSICGEELSRTPKTIPALGHDYGDPIYNWSDDGKTCTATVVCKHDGKHVVTEPSTITSEVTSKPSCENKGSITYTATFNNTLFKTQTITFDIAATEHIPAAPIKENEVAATCDQEGSYDEVVYCSICGKEIKREKKITPQITPVSQISEKTSIKVWSYNHTIYIENAPADAEYKIIDINGRVITTSKTKSTKEEIKINKSGVLIVIVDNQSFKIVN